MHATLVVRTDRHPRNHLGRASLEPFGRPSPSKVQPRTENLHRQHDATRRRSRRRLLPLRLSHDERPVARVHAENWT